MTCIIFLILFKILAEVSLQEIPLNNNKHLNVDELQLSPGGSYFYTNYLVQNRPVIIRGASKDWDSIRNWNNRSYIKEKFDKLFIKSLNGDILTFENVLFENEEFVGFLPKESTILYDVHLPLVLHCNEFIQKITGVKLHIRESRKAKITLSTVENFIAPLFSNLSVIIFDVYDSNANVKNMKLFKSWDMMHNDLSLLNISFSMLTIFPGDILYVPVHKWYYVSPKDLASYINIQVDFFEQDFSSDFTQALIHYKEFLSKQSKHLSCNNTKISFKDILEIDFNDDLAVLNLRIPKKNERPEDITLVTGNKMPVLGLGTAFLEDKTKDAIKYALEVGYRLFDLAYGYPGSEVGFANAISESSVSRDKVFVVTKLHPMFLGYNETLHAIELSLKNLNTSYINLYLIHSVVCDDLFLKCSKEPNGTWKETWRAMEQAKREGKLRDIGVSNFNTTMLSELIDWAVEPVSVVQNWFDPFHTDRPLRKLCAQHNIRYMGYSTLGSRWQFANILDYNPVLESDIISSVSAHYDYVPTHVVLRWAIHNNVTVIPRSATPNHIAQNFRTLDLVLHPADIQALDELGIWMDELLGEDDEDYN
ncbi:uncharacterized protein LOC100201016 isoform X1 [Hydra vulgaris]|uniref:uncharacterized protein LOC100201016 isoform X1 n=1 Tax=Hydra vulgaris TaxID=6087 RepID=UPI001F5FA102|nr:uncharacterized protein LOC100201016 isoform X1 [Hydra vulgaris]XP_047138328.1 uncharacterized protein LOC100201016 isoform X1 [Hydra vulgaris]XP_047138329.1 uncharacterized protein LOC100201016 isoform X2 [Hydra vulgaris]